VAERAITLNNTPGTPNNGSGKLVLVDNGEDPPLVDAKLTIRDLTSGGRVSPASGCWVLRIFSSTTSGGRELTATPPIFFSTDRDGSMRDWFDHIHLWSVNDPRADVFNAPYVIVDVRWIDVVVADQYANLRALWLTGQDPAAS
jgi:hypothetical protein